MKNFWLDRIDLRADYVGMTVSHNGVACVVTDIYEEGDWLVLTLKRKDEDKADCGS